MRTPGSAFSTAAAPCATQRSRKVSRLAMFGSGVNLTSPVPRSTFPQLPGPNALNESFFAHGRFKYNKMGRSWARASLFRGGKLSPTENCLAKRSASPSPAKTRYAGKILWADLKSDWRAILISRRSDSSKSDSALDNLDKQSE